MHPHAAQPNQIECQPEPMDCGQRRQSIVDPSYAGRRVPPRSLRAQGGGGFDSDHIPAACCEPISVTPTAGTDVKQHSRGCRQKRKCALMDGTEAKGFICLGEFPKATVVWVDCVPTHGFESHARNEAPLKKSWARRSCFENEFALCSYEFRLG